MPPASAGTLRGNELRYGWQEVIAFIGLLAKLPTLVEILCTLLSYPFSWLRAKRRLALEVLALRRQLTVLKRQTRQP